MSDQPQRVFAPVAAPPTAQPLVQRLRATDEQLVVFLRGADAVLLQWTALNLVNSHNTFNSVQAMRDELHGWVRDDGELFPDELEEFFDDFFVASRFVSVEDGSIAEVARVLHDMYRRCCANDDSTVLAYQESLVHYQRQNVTLQCQFVGGEADEDDDDAAPLPPLEDEEDGVAAAEPAPTPAPEAQAKGRNPYKKEAGGWKTVVTRKR